MIPVTKAGEMCWRRLAEATHTQKAGWVRSMQARLVLVGCRRLRRWELESKISLDKDLPFDVSLGIRRCPES